jgi:hypothetical protein
VQLKPEMAQFFPASKVIDTCPAVSGLAKTYRILVSPPFGETGQSCESTEVTAVPLGIE